MIGPPPNKNKVQDENGNVDSAWQSFFSDVYDAVVSLQNTGPTTKRPTTALFIGMSFFDSTLNKPIWLRSARPNVWVTADGLVA